MTDDAELSHVETRARTAGLVAFLNSHSKHAVTRWNEAIDAYESALWQPIETAPDDLMVLVWAAPRDDLPGFVTIAKYDEWGGWCVDELRETTHWRPPLVGPLDTSPAEDT